MYSGNNIKKEREFQMTKNNVKKIIVCLVAILLVVGVACKTYATSGNLLDEINDMLQNENGNISKNENVEQIPEGTNTNTNLNTNTNTNTNTKVNENRPATTPHAGLGNYSGLIFVAVFSVSAIYAYKKVRDYKA